MNRVLIPLYLLVGAPILLQPHLSWVSRLGAQALLPCLHLSHL